MKLKTKTPPRIAETLLRVFLPEREKQDLLGDYEEYYKEAADSKGRFIAGLWYGMQILNLIPRSIWNSTKWSFVMIGNYIKIAIRNIKKQKTNSFINITGLAVGMACSLLILLWVQDELSYDAFHVQGDRIYRVVQEVSQTTGTQDLCRTPGNLGPFLKETYPEIMASARCWSADESFSVQAKAFKASAFYVDDDFFRIFSFPLVEGDPATALTEPNALVLTQRAAHRLFGDEHPMGKIVRSRFGEDYQVTGILQNIPENSHLQFDYILSFKHFGLFSNDEWAIFDNPLYTYVLLDRRASRTAVDGKIAPVITDHAPEVETRLYLQPLRSVYRHSHYLGDLPGLGDIRYVAIFTVIAVFVLLIACINFINLTTARSVNRLREIGLRKVVGARRIQLIQQFFMETWMLTVLAMILAIGLVILFLPQFNLLAEKNLDLNPTNFVSFIGFVIVGLLTGLVSGLFPSLLLSSLNPGMMMKLNRISIFKGVGLRRLLIILQFTFSIILIVGTVTVHQQLRYIRERNLGFDKERLIHIPMIESVREHYPALKQELLNDARVLAVSFGSHILTDVTHSHGDITWEGMNPNLELPMDCLLVESDFVKTMDMQIVEGRDFSREYTTDQDGAFILNEEAVKVMGLTNPLGTKMSYSRMDGQIVGLVKDFHFRPLNHRIAPMILINSTHEMFNIFIRIAPGDVADAMDRIRGVWRKVVPDAAFDYNFFDDSIDAMYQSEVRLGILFDTFAGLAIVISCLGLFGMTLFMAERRNKEIGIRKVLGASVPGIFVLLSDGFTKWVAIANILAWPIAYYFMNKWLQNFAYRINLSIWIFLLSGLAALLIALLTVSYQTLKAATANPVDSLRYE